MIRSKILIIFCLSLGASCHNKANQKSDLSSYFFDLPVVLWKSSKIDVCWEPHSVGNPGDKLKIQERVVKEYMRTKSKNFPGIQFVGWKTCHQNSKGIRIYLSNKFTAKVKVFGALMSGLKNGMLLRNSKDSYGCYHNDPIKCMTINAVHEFGHALGFRHEQERLSERNCPEGSENPPQTTDEHGLPIGPYDHQSIMNYCNTNWNSLSPGDIDGIRKIYGGKMKFRPRDNPEKSYTEFCRRFHLGFDPIGLSCVYDETICYEQYMFLNTDPSSEIACEDIITKQQCLSKIPASFNPVWYEEDQMCDFEYNR